MDHAGAVVFAIALAGGLGFIAGLVVEFVLNRSIGRERKHLR